MRSALFFVIIFIYGFSLSAQDTGLDSLKYRIQQLEVNQQHVQLNLGQAQKQFKKGIIISTIGYSVVITGGLMLGGKNDELGTGLLIAGGAIGVGGTFILVDSFKYLGKASKRKKSPL